jgi:hypothetical protein
MNRKFFYAILIIAIIAASLSAQTRTNQIFRRCPSSTTTASVQVRTAGDIYIVPCSGKTIFAGTVDLGTFTTGLSNLTSTRLPYWNGTTFANTGIAFNNATSAYSFTGLWSQVNPTAASVPFSLTGAASQSADLIQVGSNGGTAGDRFKLTKDGFIAVADTAAAGVGVPSIFDIADTNTGVGLHGSDLMSLIAGGYVLGFDGPNKRLTADSNFQLVLNSGIAGGYGTGPDTGIGRFAPGVIKFTNGTTTITGLQGGGTAVASATALPLPTGSVFHVTGTTTVTSITSTNFGSGACIVLIFDGALTFTDGGNLKLASNYVTTADDTISLCYDGSNWYETARSVN